MIHVDAAVGSNELAPLLEAKGLPVSVLHMDFGDIAFVGRGANHSQALIGIEYKRLGELLGAMRSGRFQGHQLPGLRATYDHYWLLIEGEYRIDFSGRLLLSSAAGWKPAHGQFTVDEFRKQLLTFELCTGLRIVFVKSRTQAIQWVCSLYSWWTDQAFDEHRSHLVIYHPPSAIPVSQFRRTISTLPGIGMEMSERVETAFDGSLRRAFGATSADWARIDGFGPRKVASVIQAIA